MKNNQDDDPDGRRTVGPTSPAPTVLLVNTGSTKKRFILQKLQKLGVRVIALHSEKNWAEGYVTDWITANTSNHSEAVRAVQEYVASHPRTPFSGVLTFWEDDVLLAAKLSEELKLVGIPHAVAKRARNKLLFRQFCAEHGLPHPKHVHLSNGDLERAVRDLKFPLVVKPIFGSSSAYVVKVNDQDELEEAVSYLKKNLSINVESALRDGLGIVAEEYIDGDEVDIDMVLQNGKTKFWSMTDNSKTNEPFFIETGQSIPSALPEDDQLALLALAEETLEKLGVMNGVIHFEAKHTEKGPVPIEVNLRMGGDEAYPFVKSAWRVDLVEMALKVSLGTYIPVVRKPEGPYSYLASKDFVPKESGLLVNVSLPEKSKVSEVGELHFFKKVGDPIFAPPSGFEYLGWVAAEGENPNDARDNLERIFKQVSHDIVPFETGSSIGKTSRRSPFSAATVKSEQWRGQVRIEKLRTLPRRKQRKLTIGVACNEYQDASGVEGELSQVGHEIKQTLEERGYAVSFIDFNNLNKAFDDLQKNPADLVFNVVERINNSSLLEPHAAAFLDVLQVPYTGSNPLTLAMCIDKIKVKKLLDYNNIPTPKWDSAYTVDEAIDEELRYPLIVKPANTDNSIGVTNESVVTNKQELRAQIRRVVTELQRPALVEEYIEGDEYDVSILGNEPDDLRVLPLSRSRFEKLPPGYWHIFPYEAKRYSEPGYRDSVYKRSITVERPPKNINPKLATLLSEIALDTYNILDCHDYGRVEIRVDKDGNPYVLELNPNPSIGIGDCVPSVAEIIGMNYGDFLEEIIALAVRRYANRPAYFHLQPSVL